LEVQIIFWLGGEVLTFPHRQLWTDISVRPGFRIPEFVSTSRMSWENCRIHEYLLIKSILNDDHQDKSNNLKNFRLFSATFKLILHLSRTHGDIYSIYGQGPS